MGADTMLVCDGRAVTSVEVARSRAARRRGLLGRDGIDGALLLAPARSVHTMSMRFAIDVAHLAADGTVLRITHMSPNRIGAPVWRARAVVEAEAGSFARWGLRPGSAVAVR